MLRPAALVPLLLFVAALVGCGGDSVSTAEFRQDVLAARDQADAGLEQIVHASSVDDLLERLRVAAVEVRSASTDVREAPAPEDLEDEREALADSLLALSDEIASTVETLEEFPEQAASTRALSFVQWEAVQAQLARLRREGVNVPALERHEPEPQRQ